MTPLLELKDVNAFYGKIQALHGVNLTVHEGEIVALLGSNGAGKSTTLKVISGLVRPGAGAVSFMGQKLNAVQAHRIVELGIVHVPEGRRIFRTLTVAENLQLGAFTKRKDTAHMEKMMQYVLDLFPRLKERVRQKGGTLSGGEQQMLAIGRALMSSPKLLMLDEPSMGLAPIIVKDIMKIIREINQTGTTVLLVEQNAKAALKLADSGYVLETGHVKLHDSASNLRDNPGVIEAYLAQQ
jgi:branched-chain amino acid transport system ATP-binding protein